MVIVCNELFCSKLVCELKTCSFSFPSGEDVSGHLRRLNLGRSLSIIGRGFNRCEKKRKSTYLRKLPSDIIFYKNIYKEYRDIEIWKEVEMKKLQKFPVLDGQKKFTSGIWMEPEMWTIDHMSCSVLVSISISVPRKRVGLCISGWAVCNNSCTL